MATNRSDSSHVSTNETLNLISSSSIVPEEEEFSSSPRKRMEIFACFYLDQDHSRSKDNEEMHKQLRKIFNHLETFETIDQCEQAIENTTQEKIILIISNSLAHQIISRVHDLSQLNAFYILYQDKTIDHQWTNNYSKMKGIFTQRSELLNKLNEDHRVRIKMEDCGMISIFSENTQSLESRNAKFLWFQLFIEALLRMYHKSNTKQEFIEICKDYYQNNTEELKIIDEFNKTYKKENAIWWYTRESCFYRILNKALRIQDFDLLFALRFFITDLSKQLTDQYEQYLREIPSRDIIRVYRGQIINLDELKLIQSNIGQLISMNSFLSTSLRRRTALSFIDTMEINHQFDRILFEIDIDPRDKTKPFSNIDRLSYHQCEDELLIMLGALFRIQSIHQEKKRNIWIAQLTLASEEDFHLQQTFKHLKQKIGNETNLHSIGQILTEMGEYQQAHKCYRRMIYEAQVDQMIGYEGLGWTEHWLNHYDQALIHLQKSLQLNNQINTNISQEKGRLYSLIGLVLWRKKLYTEALNNLNKALEIQQSILPPEHPDILATYNRFAITYGSLNNPDMALIYYNKCLKIRLDTLPHDHFDIATSYNNIGWLYNEQIGDYYKALEYFQKALTICKKILPPTHRDIKRTELNIQKVKDKFKS